jgi:hypothetical protein
MRIKNRYGSLLAAVPIAFVLSVATASAQVSAGSEVSGIIEQSLSSRSAQVGDPVILDVSSSSDNYKLYGHVDEVGQASDLRAGRIAIRFDHLESPSGASCAIRATVTSVNTIPPDARGGFAANSIGRNIDIPARSTLFVRIDSAC